MLDDDLSTMCWLRTRIALTATIPAARKLATATAAKTDQNPAIRAAAEVRC